MARTAFLVAGTKGARFFQAMHGHCDVHSVVSYQPGGTAHESHAEVAAFCADKGYTLLARDRLEPSMLEGADLVFVAGWQFLLASIDERFVVMHDSLLPRFRGFAPTVTALIRGERQVGVTALKPTAMADRGPVYGQQAIAVEYPVKVRQVYERLAVAYADVARAIATHFDQHGRLPEPTAQDESRATYSLWRDELDYDIDWTSSAADIRRHVDAVGWPYLGARTSYLGTRIVLDDVEEMPDLPFEIRSPGKLWLIADNQPHVVCGQGLLRIVSARVLETGAPVRFNRLRAHMGC
ncbi:MAG: formyltransferase family protein [Betaproteobacteria bacterium]